MKHLESSCKYPYFYISSHQEPGLVSLNHSQTRKQRAGFHCVPLTHEILLSLNYLIFWVGFIYFLNNLKFDSCLHCHRINISNIMGSKILMWFKIVHQVKYTMEGFKIYFERKFICLFFFRLSWKREKAQYGDA